MEDPPAQWLPGSEGKLSERYKKDKGAAGIHGQNFEYKFCALTFLRAKNKGYKFKLASNVEGLGAFDDVVVEYLDCNYSKKHIFLQLKSKVKRHITMQQLLAERGDFSLRKYYVSYIQVENKFNCSEEVKMDGTIDESLFIIYTNADVAPDLISNKVTDIGEEKFLMAGGSVLQFDECQHTAIYHYLQYLPKHREFLRRFRIFYSQADEKQMDCYIKPELQKSMTLPDSELDLTYMCYIDIMKDWWQNCNYFLKDTNYKENDPLLKTSEGVRPILVTMILDQRKSELDELSLKYKQSAITDMRQMIELNQTVLTFAPGRSTTLTAAKIRQILSATKHIILNLQQLIRYKTEIMLAWKSMFDVLVLESDSSAEVSPDLFNELSDFLNKSDAEKKFIFISNRVGNIQQIHELRRTLHTNLTVEYDDCKFTDILTESRMLFLDKKVYFQGVEVKLSTIVKKDDVHIFNALDCDSISLLLENEKPSIGIRTEVTVDYYIDRTLQGSKHTKTRFSIRGEIQHALSRDILQEPRDISPHLEENFGRDISPHLEENFGREPATVWKPSTLTDGEGRIILVTDDPGMGKSTLLSHLAKQTRESHPDMWLVRLNINNYTRILHELKTNGCDEQGVIKLLTEAAKIKETDGVQLEGRLFNYTYNSTGNMAVLIDGVDEVSPHYTEQVIQVLKILSKTKIKRIWVTSRNSVKDWLKSELQCHSYSLVPFSEEDQKSYLVTFWKKACPQINDDNLENLAKRVVKLSTEHRSLQDKEFMGIPLQSLLLAELFEEYLQQYSTAETVQLPEHINVVMLYGRYVEKKWDIYLSEKKVSERTNVSVLTDDVELQKSFILNHKAAALVLILSTQQLEKLADKTMAERARKFLQKITEIMEKTGIIIDVIEGRPVFQHRTLAEYFAASWLCDNFQNGQKFMRDHLFESEFDVVRSMVDRILADKYPLHEAVLNSNVRLVSKLLRKKESVSEKDHGERTPLHIAVSCSNPEQISLLLEHGADVSSVDMLLGLSPVDYASRMNDWEVLSLMMEKRPDIREQVLNGTSQDSVDCITSALRAAAQYGRNDLLIYLISMGNGVNMALPGDNSTLLHVAVKSQQTETIKLLVQLGASTVSQDHFGRTPLHVSVETGNLEVISCVVESQTTVQREREMKNVSNPDRTATEGNFLNLSDVDGNTPLHLGIAAGNTNIASYLISAGSDTNICNIRGEYPLTLAARYGKYDIVELLMEGEIQCEEAQIGALRAAIVAGHMNTADLLLRLGAPVDKGENEKPIHVASQLGRKEMVSLLLQFGASLTSRTDSGNTALHLACEAGHLSLVKYLVKVDRGGMCSLNYKKESPLHLAARNGRNDVVTYFTENRCNINAPSANDATCLHVACENGHYTTVECLLKHGAEVNAMNSADQTPLHIAASRGQREIVELLFLHNANFSLPDKDGITALLAASKNGHQETVRFIVQHGGNIEDTDGKGNTIAHFAVENESYDILNFLSQRNLSLDVQNSDGDTPLLLAVREGRNRMVQFLVERNSDINTQASDGMRPLDVAVLKGNKEITRILLERNANSGDASTLIVTVARFGFVDLLQGFVATGDDVNVKADNGESPLHAACKSGQVATVQYLCELGALLDLQDNNGNTALHVAVSNGHLDVTRVLVENGANLCAADASNSTALHIAAKGGYLKIVQYLADSFAPIDRRNAKNETALLVAASEGHEKIVSVLMEQGAGIGVRDIEGKTALDIATEKNYGVITHLLKDRKEGRKLVCSSSHTVPKTESADGNFEHTQKTANAEVSMDIATQKNDVDTDWKIKTRAESTLKVPNNRCVLNTAAENGNYEQVERLVKAGSALDYGDTFGRTALWGAASRGHKYITRLLLANGSCVNIPDCEGMTPIEIAAREGHWEVVDEFLDHDSTIRTECTEYVRSRLYEASESGEPEVVGIILKCGISVNTTNKYGHTPLHVAAMSGQTEITRILLRSGANVNIPDNRGKVPLIVAAEKGHVEIIRTLLSDEAYLDGFKTFPSAALSSQEVIQEVPKNGASVVTHIENGLTSLRDEALKAEDQDVTRSLNYGARVDVTDEDGSTPLYVAAVNGHVEAVRELLKHGASVDRANSNGWTPLNAAAQEGHAEIIRELLKHGLSVDSADNEGRTPLYSAAFGGKVDVVQELMKHGASLESADNEGRTPFYTAASNGHVEVVRELLKTSANVESAINNGWTPLNAAAEEGHVEVVRELLKHGAKLENASNDGHTPLYTAAINGHFEVVRELLKYSANVESAINNGWTPLNAAAEEGHVEVVRELLKHGAKLENASNDGRTPLYTAAIKGHLEVSRELLKNGANVESAENNGWTPLNAAAVYGYLEVVRELLKHGAKLENATNDGRTPLYAAAVNGQLEVFRELVKNGANVESPNNNGWTPLNAAAYHGQVEVVRELLKHGAKLESATNDGRTPLYTAALNGQLEIFRELVKNRANVESPKNNGWTPLNAAASHGHVEVVRELLKHGAKLQNASNDGRTPLYSAASNGQVEVVRELLKNGANVESARNNAWTPLNVAASNGHVEVVRELLKHGAKLENASNDGRTPLYTAAINGHLEVSQELLNNGANVESSENNGWTPLNAAASNGYVEVVRELLKHGAKVESANNYGWTPLKSAADEGHVEVVRELLKHGAKLESSDNVGCTPLKTVAKK